MVGDQVLCQLANVLKEETRQEDVIGRWGGDEFLVLLPHTAQEDLSEITDRLRVSIKSIIIPCGMKTMSCSASIGTGTYEPEDENIEQCIVRSDNALYKAKHLGGNRTVLG
jgi:diguanylate cyclase (GGDEF)-like protein